MADYGIGGGDKRGKVGPDCYCAGPDSDPHTLDDELCDEWVPTPEDFYRIYGRPGRRA